MEVRITEVTFVDTIEVESISPLGGKISTPMVCDSLVIKISAGEVEDHPVFVRPEAIGNRIVNYPTVETEIAAMEAIVREVIFRWSGELQPEDPTNRVQVNGGTDERITVLWADGVKAKAEEELAVHTERIAASIEHFTVPR